MPIRRRHVVRAGTVAAAAGAVATATAFAVIRRWDHADGPLLDLPEGDNHTITTDDGAELAVTVAGDPAHPPIVLAHGWTCTSTIWGPMVPSLLDAGYRVVVFDQRGHGKSTFPDPNPTINRLGADLATIIEHLDLSDATIVGHSMGGMAVQALAIDQPSLVRDRARALVLSSTAAYPVGFSGITRLPPWLLRATMSSDRPGVGLRRPFGPIAMRTFLGGAPALAHLEASARMADETHPVSRGALAIAMGRMDLREQLVKVDVPTMVITGSRDRLIAPSCSRTLASAIPDARLELVDGAGHMLQFECPDRFAELVIEAASAADGGLDLA